MTKTLIVIPVYNEQETIEELLQQTAKYCPDICVVDDCSNDATAEILSRLTNVHKIRHEKNTHIAGAVLDGFAHALDSGYDYVITMDAGFSHDPSELPRFLAAPECDLIIGTRHWSSKKNIPLYRHFLSCIGTILMNRILLDSERDGPKKIMDCTSGYRRYSARAVRILLNAEMQSKSFDFLLETLSILDRQRISVREVPISYNFSNSSFTWQSAFQALKTWNDLRKS